MKHLDMYKRDCAVVDFLAEHRGKENAVNAKGIAAYLSSIGYPASGNLVQLIVRKVMRERHLPICSSTNAGFYWANTQEEIQASIDDLQSRICEHQKRIKILQSFLIK